MRPFPALNPLTLPSSIRLRDLQIFYTPHPDAPSVYHAETLRSQLGRVRLDLQHRYNLLPQGGTRTTHADDANNIKNSFRWRFVTNMSKRQLALSAQRNYLRRKWSAAFEQALREAGLDAHGQVRARGKGEQRVTLRGMAERKGVSTDGLRGVLEVHVHSGMGFDQKLNVLVARMRRLVKVLVDKQKADLDVEGSGHGYGKYSRLAGLAR